MKLKAVLHVISSKYAWDRLQILWAGVYCEGLSSPPLVKITAVVAVNYFLLCKTVVISILENCYSKCVPWTKNIGFI